MDTALFVIRCRLKALLVKARETGDWHGPNFYRDGHIQGLEEALAIIEQYLSQEGKEAEPSNG